MGQFLYLIHYAFTSVTKQIPKKVLNYDRRTQSVLLYKQLKVLPLQATYQYRILITIHKFIYNINVLPISLHCLFKLLNSSHLHTTRGSTSIDLYIPSYKKLARENSISIQGPLLWNSLPSKIKSITSLPRFKTAVHHHLITSIVM
jgi:hypothetical protein